LPREKTWYRQAAEIVVRDGVSFRQAASELQVVLDGEEANKIYRSRAFQQILWQARFEYYTEIANDPGRTKAAILGLMTLALQQLAASQQWEKVLEGGLKLARVEGWTQGEQNQNVFLNLTQRDIDEARKKLQEGLQGIELTTERTSETQPN